MSKKPKSDRQQLEDLCYIPDPWLREHAVRVADLELDPENERKHDRANVDSIKGLIRMFGIMEPIGVRNGVVIRGNGTITALRELAVEQATALRHPGENGQPGEPGPLAATLQDPDRPLDWAMVPAIVYEHLGDKAAAIWRVSHNRSAELGKWDWEALQKTLRETADVGWTELGWEQAELELLCQASWEPPAITVPDADTSGPEIEVSAAGETGTVLILKLEGRAADSMRALAEAQDMTPAEMLVGWVEMESEGPADV
jgi:hypothetical protein